MATSPYTDVNPEQLNEEGPEAVVEVEFLDSSSRGKYDDLGQGEDEVFIDYTIINKYWKDGHRYMMGLATPNTFEGDSVGFVQLASPTLIWVCDWTVSKAQSKPEIPAPEPADNSDWVLLDDHYEPAQVVLAPDGQTPIWRISGTYIYGHKRPDTTTINDATFPRAPWLKSGAFTRDVPVEKLTTGLATEEDDDFVGAEKPR
jgi:hypothetical protein